MKPSASTTIETAQAGKDGVAHWLARAGGRPHQDGENSGGLQQGNQAQADEVRQGAGGKKGGEKERKHCLHLIGTAWFGD